MAMKATPLEDPGSTSGSPSPIKKFTKKSHLSLVGKEPVYVKEKKKCTLSKEESLSWAHGIIDSGHYEPVETSTKTASPGSPSVQDDSEKLKAWLGSYNLNEGRLICRIDVEGCAEIYRSRSSQSKAGRKHFKKREFNTDPVPVFKQTHSIEGWENHRPPTFWELMDTSKRVGQRADMVDPVSYEGDPIHWAYREESYTFVGPIQPPASTLREHEKQLPLTPANDSKSTSSLATNQHPVVDHKESIRVALEKDYYHQQEWAYQNWFYHRSVLKKPYIPVSIVDSEAASVNEELEKRPQEDWQELALNDWHYRRNVLNAPPSVRSIRNDYGLYKEPRYFEDYESYTHKEHTDRKAYAKKLAMMALHSAEREDDWERVTSRTGRDYIRFWSMHKEYRNQALKAMAVPKTLARRTLERAGKRHKAGLISNKGLVQIHKQLFPQQRTKPKTKDIVPIGGPTTHYEHTMLSERLMRQYEYDLVVEKAMDNFKGPVLVEPRANLDIVREVRNKIKAAVASKKGILPDKGEYTVSEIIDMNAGKRAESVNVPKQVDITGKYESLNGILVPEGLLS